LLVNDYPKMITSSTFESNLPRLDLPFFNMKNLQPNALK